jgi:hypothetical protein
MSDKATETKDANAAAEGDEISEGGSKRESSFPQKKPAAKKRNAKKRKHSQLVNLI